MADTDSSTLELKPHATTLFSLTSVLTLIVDFFFFFFYILAELLQFVHALYLRHLFEIFIGVAITRPGNRNY